MHVAGSREEKVMEPYVDVGGFMAVVHGEIVLIDSGLVHNVRTTTKAVVQYVRCVVRYRHEEGIARIMT